MGDLAFQDENRIAIGSYQYGCIPPGQFSQKKFHLKNTGTNNISNIWVDFWTGVKYINTAYTPIFSARVLRKTGDLWEKSSVTGGATSVLKDIDTAANGIGGIYLYDGSTETPAIQTGATLNMMNHVGANPDYILIGGEVPFKDIIFTFSQAGNYGAGAFTWQYWNGVAWATLSVTDGTSKFSSNGTVTLTTLPSDWARYQPSGLGVSETYYWIRVYATNLTTQAVASAIKLGNYIYALDYCCISSRDTVKVYVDGVEESTSNYTVKYGVGWIVFNTAQTLTVTADYYYKKPQPGIYYLTFSDNTHVIVNGGSPIEISADGITEETGVIPGLGIIFNTGATAGWTATITVSDSAKYFRYAEDDNGSPSNWSETAYSYIGSLAPNDYFSFWLEWMPFNVETAIYNDRIFTFNAGGTK